MTVTDHGELARLVRDVRDEDTAGADLQGCLPRPVAAREARIVLAQLPVEDLRSVLLTGRGQIQGARG